MQFSFPKIPPIQAGEIPGFDSEVTHMMGKFRIRKREYRLFHDSGEAQYHLFLGSSGIFPTPDLLARELGHNLSCSAGLLVCESGPDKFLIASWESGMEGFVLWVHFREQLLREPESEEAPALEAQELALLKALERWELEAEQYKEPQTQAVLASLQARGLADSWECWSLTSKGRMQLDPKKPEPADELNLPLRKLLERLSEQSLSPEHLSSQEALRIHALQDLDLVEKEIFWSPTAEGRELLWDEEE